MGLQKTHSPSPQTPSSSSSTGSGSSDGVSTPQGKALPKSLLLQFKAVAPVVAVTPTSSAPATCAREDSGTPSTCSSSGSSADDSSAASTTSTALAAPVKVAPASVSILYKNGERTFVIPANCAGDAGRQFLRKFVVRQTADVEDNLDSIVDALIRRHTRSLVVVYWAALLKLEQNDTDLKAFRAVLPNNNATYRMNTLSLTAGLLRVGLPKYRDVSHRWKLHYIDKAKADFMKDDENVDRLIQKVYAYLSTNDHITRPVLHGQLIPVVEKEVLDERTKKASLLLARCMVLKLAPLAGFTPPFEPPSKGEVDRMLLSLTAAGTHINTVFNSTTEDVERGWKELRVEWGLPTEVVVDNGKDEVANEEDTDNTKEQEAKGREKPSTEESGSKRRKV